MQFWGKITNLNKVMTAFHVLSVAGPVRTAVRPWREVKSLLQSVLLPRDETGEQPPAAKKMDLSFRVRLLVISLWPHFKT